MNPNRDIAIIIAIALFVLMIIAKSAMNLAEKIIAPEPVVPITQPASTPKVSLPNPKQYYFIQCVENDIGIIFDKDGNMWYYRCENGEWKGTDRI